MSLFRPARHITSVRCREALPAADAPGARSTRLSVALWLPTLWYALEATQSVTRWLAVFGVSVGSIDPVQGSPTDRAVIFGVLLACVAVLALRKIEWHGIVAANRWLIALFLYMLVSVVWSEHPDVSAKRWVRALVDVSAALVVLTEANPLKAECAVIRRVMLVNIPLSIILIKYYRTIGTAWDDLGSEMWVGTTPHKNVLGGVAMVAALYCVFELNRNRRRPMVFALFAAYFVMTLWILRGSDTSRSTTSILGFGMGVAVMLFANGMRTRLAAARRVLLFALLVPAALLCVVWVLPSMGENSLAGSAVAATGRNTTLTGRTELWTDVTAIAMEKPILGTGYGAFWVGNTHNLWERHIWGPTQGHNGYLDVFVETGAFGVMLLLGVIGTAYVRNLRQLSSDFGLALLHVTWIFVIVTHNISESSYLRGSVDLWFLFLVATIGVPRGAPAARSRRRQGPEDRKPRRLPVRSAA